MEGKAAPKSIQLPLVRGALDQKLTLSLIASFILHVVPRALIYLPARLIVSHVLFRPFSSQVQVLGRSARASFWIKLMQFMICKLHVAQVRILLDRKHSYLKKHAEPRFKEYKEWLSEVEVNGTAGRWIAKPDTLRRDDDVVIYYIHGGGFIVDSGTNSRDFFLEIAKEFNEKRGVQCSIFSLDYRLAPEYKYPSQIIEALAGYHYLVNTLGISPSKIIISGDSAGGNLVEGFLLHLARPAPEITVPSELGPTPDKPAGCLLISPFHNLASRAPSNAANTKYDLIGPDAAFRAALDYLGVTPPPSHRFGLASLNPWLHFRPAHPNPPTIGEELHRLKQWKDVKGLEGFRNPYANPAVMREGKWWKEAFPDEGRTIVCWGGKEILADDDQELFETLEKARPLYSCSPSCLCQADDLHPSGWPQAHQAFFPTSWITKTPGPQGEFLYGFTAVCDLVQRIAREGDGSKVPLTERSISTLDQFPSASASDETLPVQSGEEVEGNKAGGKSFAEAAASTEGVKEDAPIVAEGEGAVLAMGESGVMVEKPQEGEEGK
ncbi:hypothetical protein JCM11251_006417 [Rhodosporidiobolus azoricus]